VRAMRLVGAAVFLALVAACARNSRTLPPAYPQAGFGRVGCYTGPSLQRMYSADADSGRRQSVGPWLVLDSLSGVELRRAGAADSLPLTRVARPASLLEVRDSLEWTRGTWHRPSADSIVVEEWSVFPPVNWRFQITRDGLVGEGVLGHDVVVRGADGTGQQPVSRWSVQARRVSCGEVPSVQAH